MLRRVKGPIPENQIDSAITRDIELTWENILNKPITPWITPTLSSDFGFSISSMRPPLKYRKFFDSIQMRGWIVSSKDLTFPEISTEIGLSYALPLFSLPGGFFPSGERRLYPIVDNLLRPFGVGITHLGGVWLATRSPLLSVQAGNHFSLEFSMPL